MMKACQLLRNRKPATFAVAVLNGAVWIFLTGAFLMGGPVIAQESSGITISTQKNKLQNQKHVGFQVTGLAAEDVENINQIGIESEEGQRLLQVYLGGGETALLGRVFLHDQQLIFEPRFKLGSGGFGVVFHIEKIRDDHDKPIEKGFRAAIGSCFLDRPILRAVYPTQTQLPQNVLRMYLQFSMPMQQGRAYEQIQFLDDDGQTIDAPFLEIPQELWSPDGTRLTLLFDPGRIKRGLERHEQLGPPFEIGKQYTLVVGSEWAAANERPKFRGELPKEYRYTFTITEPDRVQPSIDRWEIRTPQLNTKEPLHVRFDEPLDFGMLQHSLQVVPEGKESAVAGEVRVSKDGRDWRLLPDQTWPPGDYQLIANPRLEDRAGNSLAQPFERDLSKSNEDTSEKPNTSLRFSISDAARARPNVVFILADDLGWRDLSCTGSNFYESPNIDRICNEGICFTNGYAACQVCSPSRAAIMTGKAPARLKITDYIGAPSGKNWKRNTRLLPAFYKRHLPHEETTIAEAFREAGYKTFFAGKWHLGSEGSHPEDHGFDINVGGHRAGTPPGGFFTPYKNPKMTDGPPGECLPVRLGKETADFISQHQDEPFFAFLSFYSVHSPIQTKQSLWQKYRDKAATHPPVETRFIIDRTMPVRQVQDHPVYAGMIESMDDGVGAVLDVLDELGLAENTIVVFTSDNGGVSSGDGFSTGNLPLRGGKGRQWEGGIREPFFIRWPQRIAGGTQDETPVIGTDLYPTLLDLAGLPARPEQTLDGLSLKPILKGEPLTPRLLFWHYPHYGNQGGEPSSIVLRGEWKLIRYLEDGRTELYNLPDDSGEQIDVADKHPELVQAMLESLDAWLSKVSAEQPTSNPNFDAEAFQQWQTKMRDQRMPNLERNHARFLEKDFEPRVGWWNKVRTESSRK